MFCCNRNADETHAAAKRQLEKMVKLRTVFGLPQNQDSKEGEAFDREIQEKRKPARIEQRELAEATKVKQARALKKEPKRRENETVRAAKKAEKDAKKQEKQRQKVSPACACAAVPHSTSSICSCRRILLKSSDAKNAT